VVVWGGGGKGEERLAVCINHYAQTTL